MRVYGGLVDARFFEPNIGPPAEHVHVCTPNAGATATLRTCPAAGPATTSPQPNGNTPPPSQRSAHALATIASMPATSRSRAKTKSRSSISSTVSPPRAAMISLDSSMTSAALDDSLTVLIVCRK